MQRDMPLRFYRFSKNLAQSGMKPFVIDAIIDDRDLLFGYGVSRRQLALDLLRYRENSFVMIRTKLPLF